MEETKHTHNDISIQREKTRDMTAFEDAIRDSYGIGGRAPGWSGTRSHPRSGHRRNGGRRPVTMIPYRISKCRLSEIELEGSRLRRWRYVHFKRTCIDVAQDGIGTSSYHRWTYNTFKRNKIIVCMLLEALEVDIGYIADHANPPTCKYYPYQRCNQHEWDYMTDHSDYVKSVWEMFSTDNLIKVLYKFLEERS